MEQDKAFWQCEKCGYKGDEPIIVTATCNGQVVDIIDVMCPGKNCCSGNIGLVGTKEKVDEWWDAYYARVNNLDLSNLSVDGRSAVIPGGRDDEEDREPPLPGVF